MLKLGRMKIDNFKSFNNPVSFDFSGSDLVLFDGPNGFGKTTIFDAIELCFTGEIHRIKKTDSKTKSDHILKCDNSRITSISLELLDGIDTVLVIEATIPANISGAAGKVANYKNSIERYEYPEWSNEIDASKRKNKLDIDKLKSLLGNEKLDSTFTLFNYIQQEETSHFLKLDENKRHQQISHLFGTINETNKSKKLNEISDKLKEKIDSYRPEIDSKKIELEKLSKTTLNDLVQDESEISNKISILSDLSNSTAEQIQELKSNLEGVDWIVNNYNYFKKLKFNYQIDFMITHRINEVHNFIKLGSVSSYDEIDNLKRQYSLWKKSSTKEKSYNQLIENYDLRPNTLTKESLDKYGAIFSKKYNEFSSDIANFHSLLNGNNSCSTLLTTIEECRRNLISHYEKHVDNEKEDNIVHCPLCGDKKPDWKSLIDEYDLQTKKLEEQLDDNAKLLSKVTKKLIDELVTPLVAKMRRFNERYETYIKYDFETIYKEKFILKSEFEKMLPVKRWLLLNIDDCLNYQDINIRDIKPNYNEIKENLLSHIGSKSEPIFIDESKDYLSYINDVKSLGLSFDTEGKILIDSDDILKDINFLSRLLIQKNSSAYKLKEKELNDLTIKSKKLSLKREKILDIIKVYNKKIKAYEKDVAKNIAIPLFIYSSKILQSRPEGSGIFLVTPSAANAKGFIQFSASANDSHDAWNTMSSGQLSGVVISFMLAMNKVYPSNLFTLMIDDPVQTMDEVNMASFVQMMKYEFPEVQMLLSTHESKVANYFNYKYNEAGLKTLPINMKNRRLEALN